jgi:predicted O-methyltransferase YrrM
MTGRAQELIPGLNRVFDLVFIDGEKREYNEYFDLVIDKVRPGGYIIADNVLWSGKVVDKKTRDVQAKGIIKFNEMIKKQENIEYLILPVRDGLMLIRKI